MQQLTINIPDNKLTFFLELVQNLGFVQVDKKVNDTVLTERQKELVEIELQKIKDDPNSLLDWDEARKTLNLDYLNLE